MHGELKSRGPNRCVNTVILIYVDWKLQSLELASRNHISLGTSDEPTGQDAGLYWQFGRRDQRGEE